MSYRQDKEKEFIKDKDTLEKEDTKLSQKHGGSRILDEAEEMLEHLRKPKDGKKEKEEAKKEDAKKEEKIRPRQQTEAERRAAEERKKEEEKRMGRRKGRREDEMEHDMRDMAMGQMGQVPGANTDYDEIHRMAKNNIRDAAEAAQESLANDGLDEVAKLKDTIETGRIGDIREAVKYSSVQTTVDAFCGALTDAGSRQEYAWLGQVYDECGLDAPRYGTAFARAMAKDRNVDAAFDRMEGEMGMERGDDWD